MPDQPIILDNSMYTIVDENNLIEKDGMNTKEVIFISSKHSSPITGLERTNQEFLNKKAFAALKEDGSVVTWGDPDWGGDSSDVSSDLNNNVSQIFSTVNSFAALKNDGSVFTWGSDSGGGDSSYVSSKLQKDVVQIFSTYDSLQY